METNGIKEVKETNAPVDPAPVEGLSAEQLSEIAGGEVCTTTVRIQVGGSYFESQYDSLQSALLGTYESLIGATSGVIERVAGALKGD